MASTFDSTPQTASDAEVALLAREAQFRFLAENTADVVWQLDREMRFTYINDADYRLRGFSRDEVIGHPVTELFTPEGHAIIADVLARRREAEARGETRASLRFEAPQLRKDGSSFWVEINSMPIYDRDGKIVGFNGMTRDIDERKRYEGKLEDANRQLQAQLAEIEALQAQLLDQVLRDPLTGLHNRRYLNETLPRELARAKRESYALSLIMLDLDHFKRVNDTYGHPVGDEVLVALSGLLKQCARESDMVCRYGGEEFLMVLPRMAPADGWQRAEQLRQAVEAMVVQRGDITLHTTLSAGIAAFPRHGDTVDTLLRRADEALYRAKDLGRNRTELSQPDPAT